MFVLLQFFLIIVVFFIAGSNQQIYTVFDENVHRWTLDNKSDRLTLNCSGTMKTNEKK